MDIENRVELPDGHLVNLSPRPQRQGQYKAYRANYAAPELSNSQPLRNTQPVQRSELAECRSPSDTMFQKGKATKLPLPKSLAEKDRDQRNQTPSPTGIPKPSPSAFSSGGSGTQSAERDRDRDQYWRTLRDKFEKESSPLSQRTSYVRSRERESNEASSQGNRWQQSKYTASASREDQPINRGANPRTAIPTPSTNQSAGQNARDGHSRQSDGQNEWTIQEGQWVNDDVNETTDRSDRTDTTAESSPHSHPSVSPVSAEDSSMTDWEDRFVVHMPSAKEPNPPTMTAHQIAEYQRSIEMVHREGGHLVDPDTRPSPRNGSPVAKTSPASQRDKSSGNSGPFKAYDGRPMQPPPESDRQPSPAPQPQGSPDQPHYYSPDEIGKKRISTIWEEQSPSKTKDKRWSANADGSFLGCKEINGPGTKNPDEILLFGSGEDSATLQPRPLAIGGKKKPKEEKKTSAFRTLRKPGEDTAVQEEWSQISQNSKHVQCSKPSSMTMCQERDCSDRAIPRSGSQGSSKENYHPTESEWSSPERLDGCRGEDDVFIITPTITRTMIPTPTPENQAEKGERKVSGPKPSGLRRPGGTGQTGTGEAVKAVRAKAQVVSTPSGLRPAAAASQNKSTAPSLTSSKTTPLSSIPTAKEVISAKESSKGKNDAATKETPPKKDKENSEKGGHQATNSIRGFIRTSGLARSTGLVRSPTDSIASILRSGTESLRNRAESLRNGNGSLTNRKGSPVSQSSGPSRDNSESSRSERSFKSAREKATPPPTTKSPPAMKESPAAKPIVAEKETPADKSPLTEKPPPAEKSPSSEKSDRSSRAERLEKFKEQARLRRATKTFEIAELDGQQVSSNKDYLQPNITDVCDDLRELNSRDRGAASKDGVNTVALSMVFEIIVVAVTQMHKFVLHMTDSPYTKFLMSNVLNMTRHCYRVFTRVHRAVSRYQATGTWPKAKNDQAISRFVVELLQAIVYMFILGFGVMVVGRAASYVVLVGSWIVWFARPFAWAFQCVGRALIN